MEDLEGEVWRDVVGCEGSYMVSSLGRVKSIKRLARARNCLRIVPEKMLSQYINPTGYYVVGISIGGVVKTVLVHRLIAMAFIINDRDCPQVNHKDGNKINNSIENLEWCTPLENITHAISTGLRKGHAGRFNEKHPLRKIVYQYDLDGNFIREFPSVAEVQREIGVHSTAIGVSILRPKRLKQVRGFRWSYEKFDVFPPYVA